MKWVYKKFNDLELIELYNIFKARNEVFVVEQKCVYPDADNKDLNAVHLFAEKDGKILAYLRILNPNVSYAEASIGRVLVTSDYRGTGLGKELMQRAINYLEQNLNETCIRISAQSYLKKFYESFGFNPVSEEYLEDDIPHIQMFYSKF